MKFIASSCFTLLLLLSCATVAVCQTEIKARTDSGKEVILSPDGTWKYAPEPSAASSYTANKPQGATTLFKSTRAGFGIWYDNTKWIIESPAEDQGRIQFRLKQGDAIALAIIEGLNIPLPALKKIALDNARKAAPDFRLLSEETRTVNQRQVLCMKFDGTIKEIPFRYYAYYYSGKNGSIQLLTLTGRDLFTKYEQDLSDFLNGLEIY